MGSTPLNPLKRTLKKAYGLAVNYEQEMAGLVRVLDQSDIDATEFEEQLKKAEEATKKAEEAARQLIQTIRQAKLRMAELKEMPSPADKIADTLLVAEGLDSLLAGMPAYQLARELELVNMDSYLLAFTELSSYEGGLERLTEIRDAAERVMRERGRKLIP